MGIKIRHFLFLVLRGAGLCLLWLFWLCMILAGAYQVRLLVTHDFSLPRPVVGLIEWQLKRNGINFEFSSAVLEPSGHLLVENPAFHTSDKTRARLASARFVYAKVDPWLLMFGRLELSELRVSDLSLELPLMYSESGESENIVQGLTIGLTASDEFLDVKNFSGEIRGVRFDAEGMVPVEEMPGLDLFELKRREEAFVLKQYVRIARKISEFSSHLKGLESPRLSMDITPLNRRDAEVILHLHATSGREFSSLPHVEIEGGVMAVSRGVFRWPMRESVPMEILGKIDKLSVRIPEERGGGSLDLHEVDVRLDVGVSMQSPYVDAQGLWVGVKAMEDRTHSVIAGPLVVSVKNDELLDIAGALSWAKGRVVEVTGKINQSDVTGSLIVNAEVDDGVIGELSRLVKQPRIAEEVKIRAGAPGMMPARIRGKVFFEGKKKRPRVEEVFVESGKVEIHGVELDQVSGYATFDGRYLRCYDAAGVKGSNRVKGSYEMGVKPLSFRFLLEGVLNPPDISPWLRRGIWWTRLWDDIVFPGKPGWANVDVQIRWNPGDHKVNAFVDARGFDILAREVPFDYASVRLFVDPDDIVDLLHIYGERDGKTVSGNITVSRKNNTEKWDRIDYAGVTDLELTHETELSHPIMTEIARNLWLGEVPHIETRGWISGISDPRNIRQEGSASLSSKGPSKAWGVDLSDLSFDVVLSNDEVQIPRVSARIAGGVLAGKAQLRGLGAEMQLRVSAAVDKVNMLALYDILGELREKAGKPPLSEREWVAGDWLSGGIVAEGSPSDIYSFQGLGYLSLHAEKLAKFNLFGGLSGALRGRSPNDGGFELTDLNTNFTLKEDIIFFNKMAVTGPSALINMRGATDMRKQLVNFRAQLNPVSQTNALVSSTVGVLMMPFSGLLEVKVQGPWAHPEWVFTRGPTNLIRSFSGSESELPPIEEESKPQGPGFRYHR